MSNSAAQPYVFRDRRDAGIALAERLRAFADRPDVVVLALPRGGVPVAFEVAERLHVDLDIFVVRKIGMPGHREYAVGAIATGGVQFLDTAVLRRYAVPESAVAAVIAEERAELERREREYRQMSGRVQIRDRVAILVDDGLATGATMKAAVQAVRELGAARVVVAVPVGASSSCAELATLADDVVCVHAPDDFSAVGQWYVDFNQTPDDEVRALLSAHTSRAPGVGGRS